MLYSFHFFFIAAAVHLRSSEPNAEPLAQLGPAQPEPTAGRPVLDAQALGSEMMSLLAGGEQALRSAGRSALGLSGGAASLLEEEQSPRGDLDPASFPTGF